MVICVITFIVSINCSSLLCRLKQTHISSSKTLNFIPLQSSLRFNISFFGTEIKCFKSKHHWIKLPTCVCVCVCKDLKVLHT